MVAPIFSMEKGFKKECGSIIPIVLFLVVTIIYFFLYDNQKVMEIDVGYIMFVSGLTYLIAKYLNFKNIRKLAINKKNFIQDLS